MDEKIEKLNRRNVVWAANMVSVDGTLEEALQLQGDPGNKFYPVHLQHQEHRDDQIENSGLLYLGHDREYEVIERMFGGNEHPIFQGKVSMLGSDAYHKTPLPYHHLLNLPNTTKDVRFRQEAVKEFIKNKELYDFFEKLLIDASKLFPDGSAHDYTSVSVSCDGTPEKLAVFLDNLLELEKFDLKSEAFKRLYSWACEMRDDIYFCELLRKKRKITDSRIFAVFTERFKQGRFGMLKPGIKPEDVFVFLEDDISMYAVEKMDRRGTRKIEERKVVKFKDGWDDEGLVAQAIGHARQRMDIVNEIASQILAVPAFLVHLQIKHYFQGAFLHHELQKYDYPSTFPEIVDEPGVLELTEIYPIRMIFQRIAHEPRTQELQPEYQSRYRPPTAPNWFNFLPEHRVIQAEGPNKRGKSEAWRTVHLLIALTNAGYPSPVVDARYSPVPCSHLISCKGERGYGGSELERSLRGVEKQLMDVHLGETVILDELGDSTNAHTAREMAKRLLPVLIKKGCRVFVTSHHDALTGYISEELNGLSFMPNPEEGDVNRFQLVPRKGEVDFLAAETLDDLEFTSEKIAGTIKDEKRTSTDIRRPQEKDRHRFPGDPDYDDPAW
ncbi:MAG: hypothetical protein KAT43_02495 [Nanoarchaeota archaeon]|nr:hypothetical protein [Nanoarchaeota archaeon]